MTILHPQLGTGIGLRTCHLHDILERQPKIDWLEIIAENFLAPMGSRPHFYLQKIAEHYPLVLHGVGLSIGGMDALDFHYLKRVKALVLQYQIKWVSDHLCWTHVDGKCLHDLMPLPFTEEALTHVVGRIKQVQEFLGQRIILENVSSYVAANFSAMSEAEFLKEVAEQADCLILLDVNNVYVNAINHHFSAEHYIKTLPHDRVQQLHLAGHSQNQCVLVDTHDHGVVDAVWDLYQQAVKRFPGASTLIEWDANIPPLDDLLKLVDKAKELA